MASTVWKGHLTFGLVSLPVRLFSAARAESVSFNQLHKHDNSRVRQVLYCQAEDKPIPRTEIVKGYEYEKDRYVVVDDEDIRKAAPKTAKVMEILEFVDTAAVDPVYFESSYWMSPEDAGEKPYALLFDALKRTGKVGIAKIAMHNREHIVILRPGPKGIVLHTMYYAHEIRGMEEFRTDLSLVREKEIELATGLVEALAADFEPGKYTDNYRDNLLAMIEAKKAGREIVEPAAPTPAKVVDILEALKASLDAARKPATVATQATPISAAEDTKARKQRSPRKVVNA
jgi:DNA end-binding protein Ku